MFPGQAWGCYMFFRFLEGSHTGWGMSGLLELELNKTLIDECTN